MVQVTETFGFHANILYNKVTYIINTIITKEEISSIMSTFAISVIL